VSDLLAARLLMGISLGFHIVFAVVGIGMPLLMVISEGLWLRTGRPVYLELTHRWLKGTALMFAVGAVSGTVLSFELGLLWPAFMRYAGALIGMPFSLEGFAFFLEAIFLGIYVYGWERVSPRMHWLAGWVILASSLLSGAFVVTANAWMNAPAGFDLVNGRPENVQPFAAMFNAAAFSQVLHMTVATLIALGFAVAAVHARMLLRQPGHPFHRRAYAIALAVGGAAALLGPVTGDISAKDVAARQPLKLAAMEAHWETAPAAPLLLGGWPDEAAETTRYAIPVPYALSLLAFNDPGATVRGLKDWPADERPPVAVTHWAFQLMVACGTELAAVALLGAWLAWRTRRLPVQRAYLWLVLLSGPLGFVAIEAGWTVTEVGRQPWIVYGLLRTSAAVTPLPWLPLRLVLFTAVYVFLGCIVTVLMRQQVFQSPALPAGQDAGRGA
jgi:cytochrome bd ubiquinol oxidase subunit I